MAGVLGKPCKATRCSAIVTGDNRYCEAHKDLEWGGSNVYTGIREPLTFYSQTRWQKIRKLKLAQNPVCEVCQRMFATQVHHLEKARDRPDLRFSMENLQSICHWCHARETQKETQETRNGQKKTPDAKS